MDIKEKEVDNTVTFVGNLSRWASVEKIIKAAKILEKNDLIFYIVGTGSDEPRIRHIIKQYNLKNVILTGQVPITRAYKYISNSQILLSPFPKSIALAIACPIKLLEYMAFGKPIVTDGVGEIPLMLKKEKAASVSNPDDEQDFIRKIEILVNDKKLRTQISKNAKKLSQIFSWDRQSRNLAEIYSNYIL